MYVYTLYDDDPRVHTDHLRAVTAMAIIGLCVAVTANAFTIYAIFRPRYVLRRLAGCLQVGAGQTYRLHRNVIILVTAKDLFYCFCRKRHQKVNQILYVLYLYCLKGLCVFGGRGRGRGRGRV